MPRRSPAPSIVLVGIAHDVAHLTDALPKIHAQYRNSPAPDGLRSPAPGSGGRQVGTHSDPTYSALSLRADPHDPAEALARITTQLTFLAKLSRTLCLEASLLGYPCPPMPACSDCKVHGRAMEGGRCQACARAHRRAAQRALDAQRAGRGVTG